MLIASAEEARLTRSRKHSHGVGFWYSRYMGFGRHDIQPGMTVPAPGALAPTAFLVEQDPGTEIRPHFHIASQFQVFVDGDGKIGKHEARDLTVYFTSAYTPYGPLRAGPEGLKFFTFRDGIDFGARYMPQARELRKMPRMPRFAYGGPVERASPAEASSADHALIPLFEAETEGLGAWLHELPAGEPITGPEPKTGGGQFWLVLSGDGRKGSNSLLSTQSCLFVSPEESAVMLVAGEGGLHVLLLQFPKRA